MRQATCPSQNRLVDYLRGELAEAELEAVTAHLECCASCETAVEALDGQADPVLDVLRRLESPGPLPSTWRDGPPSWARAETGSFRPNSSVIRVVFREALPKRLGSYEVLSELGRGGMGVVYLGWDPGLKRHVALKVVREGAGTGADDFIRFRREAEAAARLQHPNLVQVYEIGHQDGRPFLALEYIAGGSLDRYLAGRPQPVRSAACLVATLADAIQHAHQHGVVHRDLKPANVLLQGAECGVPNAGFQAEVRNLHSAIPKITDFGLAKRLNAGVCPTATKFVVGTPQYMAPEQARGEPVSPAADVYGLGAILYEMLTGRPPFAGATPVEILLNVLQQEPVPVQRVRPEVPRDLATLCMKCLHKEPARRYASAAALADDLRRFLDGHTTLARPAGPIERTAKWVRRYPALAGALAATLLVTVVGFMLVTWQWGRAEAQATAEAKARHEVEHLSADVVLDQALSTSAGGDIDRGLLTFADALDAAHRAGATDLERVARFNLAAWRPLLIRSRARFAHRCWVWTVAFSPDGRIAATAGDDGWVRRWDTATGQPIGQPLYHAHAVWTLAFSPDGKTLLTGSGNDKLKAGEARLWDAVMGEPRCPPLPHDNEVGTVAFRPGGREFLTVCAAGAQRWDVATCSPLGSCLRHELATDTPRVGAYSPDGKWLATGSGGPLFVEGNRGQVRLWDADTGAPVGSPVNQAGPVQSLAFSPDSQTLATGSAAVEWSGDPRTVNRVEGEVRLVAVANGQERGAPLRHQGPVRALAFSPDGQYLAAGLGTFELGQGTKDWSSVGGQVRLWRIRTGEQVGRQLTLPAAVWAVAFSPDGRLLLTGDQSGHACFFDVASGDLIGKPLPHEGTVQQVVFSPDGRLALTASAGGDHYAAGRLWEVPALQIGRPVTPPAAPLTRKFHIDALAFSPDGRHLLANSSAASVRALELAMGQPIGPAYSHPDKDWIGFAAYDSEGTRCVTCSKEGARLWDAAGGRLLAECPRTGTIKRAAFGSGPDGPVLLTASAEGSVQFWRARDGAAVGPPQQFKGAIVATAFLANGTARWVEKDEQGFQVWQGGPSKPATLLLRQPVAIWDAVFSPDTRLVLTTGRDCTAQLWDTATGRPCSPALSHHGAIIHTLAFSGDGRVFLTGGRDRAVRLWDTATAKPLGPPLMHRALVLSAVFDPTGRTVAVGCDDGAIHLWELPTTQDGEPDQLRRWAERLTGLTRDSAGAIHDVEAAPAAP